MKWGVTDMRDELTELMEKHQRLSGLIDYMQSNYHESMTNSDFNSHFLITGKLLREQSEITERIFDLLYSDIGR